MTWWPAPRCCGSQIPHGPRGGRCPRKESAMSHAWSVRFGRGWLDGNPPPDVRKVLEVHTPDPYRLAVLCVHSDSHIDGFRSSSDLPFWERMSPGAEVEAAAKIFGAVDRFLANLTSETVDVASIIFVNFKPRTFSLTPRPEELISDVHSLPEGLQLFCASVAASIRVEGMWSLCAWAMLTCTREPTE